jgi:hypothetical protein
MSDDLTAAPDINTRHLHSVSTFKLKVGDRFYSYRTGTICELMEDARVIIKETPADLCAPVDAEGAVKGIVAYCEREHGNQCMLDDNDEMPALSAVVRSHCNSAEVTRLQAERLEIQRALAATVLDDPAEDDEPPYSTTELVNGINQLDQRRRNAVSRAATARAEAIRECLEKVKAMRVDVQEEADAEKAMGFVGAAAQLCVIDEIIAALLEGESK